jgi:hypothetical protein
MKKKSGVYTCLKNGNHFRLNFKFLDCRHTMDITALLNVLPPKMIADHKFREELTYETQIVAECCDLQDSIKRIAPSFWGILKMFCCLDDDTFEIDKAMRKLNFLQKDYDMKTTDLVSCLQSLPSLLTWSAEFTLNASTKRGATGQLKQYFYIEWVHCSASVARFYMQACLQMMTSVERIVKDRLKAGYDFAPHNINAECCICMEEKADGVFTQFACGHQFHKACFAQQVNTAIELLTPVKCALCRQVIDIK